VRSSRKLERGASADLWRNTLSQLPTAFGRMTYLASLRDVNSGRYSHHGMALVFGEVESSRTLRASHKQVFAEWLRFNLEQQKADLDLYLSGLPEDKQTLLETWHQLRPYENVLPASVRKVEKELFLADLETLLKLLRNVHGVAAPNPDA